MATLVVRHPDGSESEHELSGELKIGRQEGTNDLVLAEGGVSRRHARFFEEGGKVLVEDVGSANGTLVDGQRITGMTPITAKSQVLLGDYEVRLKADNPRSTRSMPATRRPAPGAAGGPSALAKRPRPAPAADASEEAGPPVLLLAPVVPAASGGA